MVGGRVGAAEVLVVGVGEGEAVESAAGERFAELFTGQVVGEGRGDAVADVGDQATEAVVGVRYAGGGVGIGDGLEGTGVVESVFSSMLWALAGGR